MEFCGLQDLVGCGSELRRNEDTWGSALENWACDNVTMESETTEKNFGEKRTG